jgi:CDP-diacylglycerol--serine O-phosphatidyltransferase
MASQIRPAKAATELARRRGIYLLPNLFTTLNLFAGFYAIVQGMNHDFEKASVAIFVAMVLDSIDGRVARLTRTQSAFGAEYDSLSDMVSFGAAPALVMYEWALRDLGRIGWIAAFVYCVGAALRLARFNTQLSSADKRWFTGLPSPAAAALVAGMIWVLNDYQVRGGDVKFLAAGLTIYAGITMVSNVKFYSGKDINLRRAVPFSVALFVVMALLLISIEPSHVLWGVMMGYGVSGYVHWAVQRYRADAIREHPRRGGGGESRGPRAHAEHDARRRGGRDRQSNAPLDRGGGDQPSGARAPHRARRVARPS